MLTFQRYRELCREASVALKLDDPDRLGNEGYMERDGIRVALFFDEEIVSDRIFCYVDLGPIVSCSHKNIRAFTNAQPAERNEDKWCVFDRSR